MRFAAAVFDLDGPLLAAPLDLLNFLQPTAQLRKGNP